MSNAGKTDVLNFGSLKLTEKDIAAYYSSDKVLLLPLIALTGKIEAYVTDHLTRSIAGFSSIAYAHLYVADSPIGESVPVWC